MRREAQKLLVDDELPAEHPQVGRDDRLHLVKQDLSRDTAEVGEGGVEPGEERPHVLAEREADVEQPGVAEDGDEGVALAPGELELGEVDLRLVPRRGLEADDRLGRRSRADAADEVADLAVAAGIAIGADLVEEADVEEADVEEADVEEADVEEADGGDLGIVGEPGEDDGDPVALVSMLPPVSLIVPTPERISP